MRSEEEIRNAIKTHEDCLTELNTNGFAFTGTRDEGVLEHYKRNHISAMGILRWVLGPQE